jgi:23S rRNA G2069 N7-methylase RlmK/C1962 C5-methylase RlmI
VLSLCGEYNTDIITLFHACGEFNNRSNWMEGVKKMEEVGHYLPRVGMRSRIVNEKGKTMVYSSSYHYERDHIEFSETNESNAQVMYFTLQSLGPEKSGLAIDYYVPKSVGALSFKLFEAKSLRKRLERSLQRLEDFLKTHRVK